MEKVLITGGAGFIGSHFIKYLLKKTSAWEITNVDKLTYAGNLKTLSEIASDSRYQFVQADIIDFQKMRKLTSGASLIVNFAAESHVDRSIEDASPFVKTNVEGTRVLLEVARINKVKKFVQVSTDEVYGSIKTGQFTESSTVKPSSPYSASKAAADMLVLAYVKTYGLPAVITRCSNNYGSYQFPEKLIPFFTTRVLKDEPLPLYGNGHNIRDWIYVLDHCEAIHAVMDEGEVGEVYNIGAECEKTNLEIVQLILKHFNKPPSLIKFVKDRLGHDERYAISNKKMQTQIGWTPRYSFDDKFPETLDWYAKHLNWWN
ncbi:MAG TPA: dTDP-glucose 4,6-dehydratase [Bdellovibrionota bacterium]|nr:dTDP-glucose 4,6-dehydratase [Bdellovibrionota bacterium]